MAREKKKPDIVETMTTGQGKNKRYLCFEDLTAEEKRRWLKRWT